MSGNDITFKNLRLVHAPLLKNYLKNTQLWRQIGNEAFARHVITGTNEEPDNTVADETYCFYHSWLPVIKEVNKIEADKIQQLISSDDASLLTPEMQNWTIGLKNAGWLEDKSADIDALVERALTGIIAIQNRYEVTEYLKLIQKKRPKVIVEIGTARGGMLYCFSQLAADDALIVSIDLPGAPNCGGQTDDERQFFSSFTSTNQTLEFIPADSHLPETKELLKNILQGRKADVLFIDGDHSRKGVEQDYEMYKEFAADDCLITFHDIKMYPKIWGVGNEVGLFWDEIAPTQAVTEIVDPDGMCKPHRPEGVEACWGIGILGKHSA
ncbi:MAG: class I SAM-dependent methyltransferase [Gammaproteobacteria bacterium]|nr:class I SAM-dependent methyltransferase [Gammaproteobacteria bacterium]